MDNAVNGLLATLWGLADRSAGFPIYDLPGLQRDEAILIRSHDKGLIEFGRLREPAPWIRGHVHPWQYEHTGNQLYGTFLRPALESESNGLRVRLTSDGEVLSCQPQREAGPKKKEVEAKEDRPKEKTYHHATWHGSTEWNNWGIGVDELGQWHVFHFARPEDDATPYHGWTRHSRAQLQLPEGHQTEIATEFAKTGRLSATEPAEIARLKAPISRLRSAIKAVVKKEGHKPTGSPIKWRSKESDWAPVVAFGTARMAGNRHIVFSPVNRLVARGLHETESPVVQPDASAASDSNNPSASGNPFPILSALAAD